MPRFDEGVEITKLEYADILLTGNPGEYSKILAQNILVEDITRASLQTLITNSRLVRGKLYRITDAVGSTLSIIVQALTANTLGDISYNSATGDIYTYSISTDTGSVGLNLGENGLNTGFVTYDTTPTNTPTSQATTYWDSTEETLALIMNGVTQRVGLDTFFNAKNSTGTSIPKGTAVRFAGTDGNSGNLLIAPMLADGTYPSVYYMGITAEAIGNGEFGKVMSLGKMLGVNTNAYVDGDILYVSSTVAGGFQTTAPLAPNNIIVAAAVVNAANNGVLEVRATLGSNINNDEGVKITTPLTGQLLQLQSNGLWENKTLPIHDAVTLGTANGLSLAGQVLSLGLSSSSANGALSSTDWSTFNAKQAALNGTGFVKISGTTISYDNSTYLTGNQTITLSGDISGSGATSITTTIGAGKVTNAMLAGSIAASKLLGTDIATVGTITSGVWQGTAIGDTYISSASTWNAKIGGSGTTNYIPKFTASGTVGDSIVSESGSAIIIDSTSSTILAITSNSNSLFRGLVIGVTADSTEYASFKYQPSIGELRINGSPSGFGGFVTFYNNQIEAFRISTTNQIITNNATNTGEHFIVGGSARVNGALDVRNANAFFGSQKGYTYIIDDQINSYYSADSNEKLNINYFGYNGGATRSRSLEIFDGKTNSILLLNGVTGAATFSSSVRANGRLLVNTSGVGNDFVGIKFDSSTTFSQAINIVDSNASASDSVFAVFRKSDDTYLGNIRRNGTDDAMYIGGNSYLALGAGNTEYMRIASTGAATFSSSVSAKTQGVSTNFNTGSFIARSNSSDLKYAQLGYDATGDYGWIQCIHQGTAYTNLVLNAGGGNVGIGTTTPGSKLSIVGLPTSSAGLSAGDVWNNGGVLTIV
jgi:hypothetical protein